MSKKPKPPECITGVHFTSPALWPKCQCGRLDPGNVGESDGSQTTIVMEPGSYKSVQISGSFKMMDRVAYERRR